MSLLELLGLKRRPDGDQQDRTQSDSVRAIVAALDQLPPDRAQILAAFAYLLGRVAYADRDTSTTEIRAMEALVSDQGNVPRDQAAVVVEMARRQAELFGGTEDFLVAREFRALTSRDERLGLLRCLFAVAAADDSVSTDEDATIRQVASELGLDHRDYVAARLTVKQYLEVLRST